MAGTGKLGVLGVARNLSTGETSPMIFADVGPRDHALGEVSVKLAEYSAARMSARAPAAARRAGLSPM